MDITDAQKKTISEMVTTLEADSSEFIVWLTAAVSDPEVKYPEHVTVIADLIRKILTTRQLDYMVAYFVDGMTLGEIAEEYGVRKSSPSCGIGSGIERLSRLLNYPRLYSKAKLARNNRRRAYLASKQKKL